MKQILFAVMLISLIGLSAACSPVTQQDVPPTSQPKELLAVNTAAAPDYQWVQFGADNAVFARAIYKKTAQDCPKIEAIRNDGTSESIQMNNRLPKTVKQMPQNFTEITVCEATLSADLKSAKLGGKDLSIPNKKLERVVVIGDTGCRITQNQDCNDNTVKTTNSKSNESASSANSSNGDWDFKETIKSAQGLTKTNLVIHVGDYVYRECDNVAECGVDDGKNWKTWEADFFGSAAPLLENVPWVFTRGNHEDCSREWRGWNLFFDPRPLTDTSLTQCNSHAEGFQVKLEGLNLLVLDSSDEQGLSSNDLASVKTAAAPTWLVTHVPLYGVSHYGNATPQPAAAKDAITGSNIKFLVSGHIHFFEMIQFPTSSKIPPQMISGGGATKLDHHVSQADFKTAVTSIGGDPSLSELIGATFTFAYVDFEAGDWKITVDDQDGATEDRTFKVDN